MTPNLVILYAASIACIALLAAFARHNRKTGWVKQRNTQLEDLIALSLSFEQLEREKELRQVSPAPALTPEYAAAFSNQLAQLQGALETRVEKVVAVREAVAQ